MKNILITGALKLTDEMKKDLEKIDVKYTYIQEEREKLNIDLSIYDGVICNSLFIHNDIAGFKNLKWIHATSAGLDRLPMDYIEKNNIKVHRANGVYSTPIAEWVLLKILEIYKKSKTFINQQEKNEWIKHRDLRELSGKNVAIVGFGDIGNEIFKRLKGFNLNIYAVDIKKIQNEYIIESLSIKEFENYIKNMDIIILTLPLTSDTKYLINLKTLNMMKKNSLLINVSRGEIVNEDDLIEVLSIRNDITAILDVFEIEPLDINSRLWKMENVFVTPHNSFVSLNNEKRLFDLIFKRLGEEL